MNTVNIAIVEDNPEDFIRLKEYLKCYENDCRYDFLIQHFPSGEAFISSHLSFHLVFMDIELPGIDGLDTSKKLRDENSNAILVLVTNMVQYAIHGYAVKAVDYIVKPIIYEQLALKMPGFLSMTKRRQKSLLVKQKNSMIKINIHEIRFIEVFKHDLFIQTEDKKINCRGTLAEYKTELEGYGFMKCSQSCLVNLFFVQKISSDVIIVDGHSIQLSRRKKKAFQAAFIRYEKDW